MEIHELQEMTLPQDGFWLPIDTGDASYKIDYAKVRNQEIQNNLTTTEPGSTLDAVQGHVLNEKIGTLKDNIAPTESGDTASTAYAKGDVFFYDDALMKAKTLISAGENLTEGTNMEASTIAAAIAAMLSEDNIKIGRGNFTAAANSVSSLSISFGKTFKAAPLVFVSHLYNSQTYAFGGVTIAAGDVTRTGMKIYAFNNTSTSFSLSVNYLALTF